MNDPEIDVRWDSGRSGGGERTAAGAQRAQSEWPVEELSAEFLVAIRAADGPAAELVARRALRVGLPLAVLYDRVIAPAMVRIGELWSSGDVGVADEHVATAIAHRVLAAAYSEALTRVPSHESRVIVAAVEGERHGLAVRMAADVLELAGHGAINLSTDVPTASLLEAIFKHRPHLVGISVTMAENVPALAAAIDGTRSIAPGLPIVVGGAAIPPSGPGRGDVHHVGSLERLVAVVAQLIGPEPTEVPVGRPASDGAARPAQPAAPAPGPPEAVVGPLLEATEEVAELVREKAREALEYRRLAFMDPLSGLPNRRAFDDRFGELLAAGRTPVGALLMIDIDGFKRINDEFGHEVGDRTLARVADLLEAECRREELAARFGGDEFAVLLPGADAGVARRAGERLMRRIVEQFGDPPLTVSIGVATIAGDERATVIAADQALYAAKASGRNAIRVAERPELLEPL